MGPQPTVSEVSTTVNEDGSITVTIPMNGADAATMQFSTSRPQHGAVTGSGPVFVYHPAINFAGTDSFRVTISDGEKSVIVPVFITVGAVNDPPVAVDDAFTTLEDTSLVFPTSAILANDYDVDSPHLTVTAVTQPTQTICLQPGQCGGPAVTLVNSIITYRPSHNFNGMQSFQYTVSDGELTAVGTVTVTVTAVNDAPVANDDVVQGTEDTTLVIQMSTLLENDYDVDGQTPMITHVGQPEHGEIGVDGTTITYFPDANYNGNDGFLYTISDGSLTSSAFVTLAIAAVDDAPVAKDDVVQGSEDTALVIPMSTLLANDIEVDGRTMVVTDVGTTEHGELDVDFVGATITYIPDPDYNGDDGFSYSISDGVLTSSASVAITMLAVDDAPVAQAASTTSTGAPVDVIVTATDIDSTDLTFAVDSQPTSGSVTNVGSTFTYTPTQGFSGTDSFTFTASDGTLSSAPAVVTITVTAVDAPPVPDQPFQVVNLPFNGCGIQQDFTADVPVSATDPDSTTLTYSIVFFDNMGGGGQGFATLVQTGPQMFQYHRAGGDGCFFGEDFLEWQVTDEQGQSATGVVVFRNDFL